MKVQLAACTNLPSMSAAVKKTLSRLINVQTSTSASLNGRSLISHAIICCSLDNISISLSKSLNRWAAEVKLKCVRISNVELTHC